jgi:hypothetical protein
VDRQVHGSWAHLGTENDRALPRPIEPPVPGLLSSVPLVDRPHKRGFRPTFLKSHWGVIVATDFYNVELLTSAGLIRDFVLFVIDL